MQINWKRDPHVTFKGLENANEIFFDLKNVTEIKHILKGNPQKLIKMNAGKKQRYILVQWISLLGFNNNNTHTHIAYLRWFPSVWAWINFLSAKNGFFYSEFHSSKSGLNFSLVLWETMLWKWLQIMSTWGVSEMLLCLHRHTAQTKAPAYQQHSVDLLIFSNMVPAEAQ